MPAPSSTPTDKFIHVEGLNTRYLEQGEGSVVLLLHGAALGSSSDVWARNLPAFAARGFRAIAFDQPGFGLSDNPTNRSVSYRERFILTFMDALHIHQAHLIGHSQSGRIAVDLAFTHPQRVTKVVVLGTGSLLPPLPGGKQNAAREGEEGAATEPTLAETRALLEANLFNHDLITPAVLETRHRMSVGKNFVAFAARKHSGRDKGEKNTMPFWRRLSECPAPLLLLYGKEDRGAAAERAALAIQMYPQLDLHLLERCKHLIQWDAASEFITLASRFLGDVARPAVGKAI